MAKADAIAEAYEPGLNERSSRSTIVAGLALVIVGILYVVATATAAWLWPFLGWRVLAPQRPNLFVINFSNPHARFAIFDPAIQQ